MTIYSLDVLLFLFGTSLLFHVQLTCIQISQEAGQVVFYSYLFQNFPEFIVIHKVKGLGIVNKAEIYVFLELSCFFNDSAGLAIWSLVSLPFPKPVWTSGSLWFTYCWSLAWRILSITLLVGEMSDSFIFVWSFFSCFLGCLLPVGLKKFFLFIFFRYLVIWGLLHIYTLGTGTLTESVVWVGRIYFSRISWLGPSSERFLILGVCKSCLLNDGLFS